MKKISKSLRMLSLIVFMFFGLIGVTKAAEYDVDKAVVIVPTPTVGEKAGDYKTAKFFKWKERCGSTACIIKGSSNNIIDITWKDESGTVLSDNDTFKNGTKYKPVFATYKDDGLSPSDFYTITDDSWLSINPEGRETFNTNVKADVAALEAIEKALTEDDKYGNWEGITPTQLVSEVSYTAAVPVAGEVPSTTATIEADADGAFTITNVDIEWYKSVDNSSYDLMEADEKFETGYFYTYEVLLEKDLKDYLNDNYIMAKTYSKLYNEKIYDELYFELPYTYEFLDETDDLKGIASKVEELVVRIDADKDTLEYVKIGDLELEATDYEVTKGSTIITLIESGLKKINALEKGVYEIKVKFAGRDAEVVGKLTLTEEEVNPKTGDNLMMYVLISVISLSSVAGLYLCKKKIKG